MNALVPLMVAADKAQGGGLVSLLVLLLPLGALVYLMIVPQRKQRAKQAAFLSSLSVGDEVVTAGGVYGRITFLEDGVAHLEIDTDVVIRVSLGSLTRSAADPAPNARSSPARGGATRDRKKADGDDDEA